MPDDFRSSGISSGGTFEPTAVIIATPTVTPFDVALHLLQVAGDQRFRDLVGSCDVVVQEGGAVNLSFHLRTAEKPNADS